MPGDAHCAPLTSWSRSVPVATVLAYRASLGKRSEAMPAFQAARTSFVAAGGNPQRAAARDHPEWLYRPARARIAREEAHWKGRGVWPPPKDRSLWPKELPA